jgi:hypothetical protein
MVIDDVKKLIEIRNRAKAAGNDEPRFHPDIKQDDPTILFYKTAREDVLFLCSILINAINESNKGQ